MRMRVKLEITLVKIIERLGRILFAGLFIRIGPHHLEFETLATDEEKATPRE
jgi:hypothetical protein